MGKNDKLSRLDDDFLRDMEEVKLGRINNGLEPVGKPVGNKRLSKAIHKHPLFSKIKEDMKKADLPNKRGNIMGLSSIIAGVIIFIIVAFILVLILAVWVNNFGTITDMLVTLPAQNNVTNFSQYADVTFGNINDAFGQFRWWAIMIIFGLAVGLLLSNFLIKIHPAYFIVYVLIAVVLIVFSIIIANTYETLYTGGGALGDSLNTFKGASWMILYLPIWVTVLSIIGGILLFVSIGRDDSQGSFV